MSKSLQVLGRCSSDETINAGTLAQIVLFTSIETDGTGTDPNIEIPISVDATLSDLGIKITANSLDADCVFTLSKNATETSLQVTVATTDTGWFTDAVNTVSVATSTTTPDKISIKVDASAATTGSISFSVAHLVYEPNDAGETLTVYGCNRGGNVNMNSASTTYRFTPHGLTGSDTSSAVHMQRVSRLAGDLKFFTAWAAVNNRTTDVDFVVNVEGSDGTNALTFSVLDVVQADYTSADTIAVGDEIYYKGTTGLGTEAFTLESIGSQIVTSDDKFAITSGSGAGEVTPQGTTKYIPLGGELDESFATEVEAEVTLPFDMDFLELFADMRSVLSDTSSTINLRVNGVTELTVTPTAAGEFTDTGTISASAGDTACIQIITATGSSAFRPYEIIVVAQEAATNVSANTESLTLTAHDAVIALDVAVAANVDALTLTTFSATIATDTNIDANAESLTLTTQPASVAFDVDIAANVESLTLTTHQAILSQDVDVSANVESLTLATYSAGVALDVSVLANAEILTLATYSASISDGTEFDISVAVEALTLTTNAATIGAFQAFTFPTVDNFSGLWVTNPLDKVKVLEIDGTEKTTFAYFDGDYTQHAQPIQLDRFGNIPSIYFESGDCQVRLYNKFGVEKYAITRSGGAWYVGGVDSIEANAETLTLATYPARINNAVQAITESLVITPYEAGIELATFTPTSATLTLTTNNADVFII